MAYVHPTVTVPGTHMFFFVHTQERVGLVAYCGLGHVRLEGKCMPGEDTLS